MSETERLQQQIQFVLELDKLKTVLRQTYLLDKSRQENTAEHSWHIAMMVLVLTEYAKTKIDILKTLKLLLVHDVVEIDAGDTFIYDKKNIETKHLREQQAADRIFKILPEDQAKEIRSLWDEYESGKTAESKFAHVIDRLHPILHNFHTGGMAWKKHGIKAEQVEERNKTWIQDSPQLWNFAKGLIDEAKQKGYLI